jgi:ABC-2 type transport system permease protein
LYANRLSQSMRDSLAKFNTPFIPQCIQKTKVVVVADGDIVLNSIVKGNEPIPMGMNPYTYGSQREFPFANRSFLLNCIDYLVDENGLSESKAKDYSIRLLDQKKVSNEKTKWQVLNIVLPVLVVLLAGFIYQWYRKRKYTA